MKNYLQSVFALDERSLGLARILIGLLGAFYFFEYFKEVDLLYSENAILSYRNIIRLTTGQEFIYPFRLIRDLPLFPLLKFSQQSGFVTAVTLTGMFSALMVMIGYQTKFFSLLAWLIGTTMYDRFPSVFHGGDLMLKLSFLWMYFLPSERCFSFDAKKCLSDLNYSHYSLASALWVLQIVLLYVLNVYYKMIDPKWYPELNAFYYLGHADYVLSIPGKILQFMPYEAGRIATALVLLLEAFVPFLLFVPRKTTLKLSVITVFILFHAAIWLSINVSFVSQFTIVWWLSLLPAEFWSREGIKSKTAKYLTSNFTAVPEQFSVFRRSFLILVVTCIGLSTVNIMNDNKLFPMRSPVSAVVRWLQLEQWWSMFSRNPKLDYDGWFVAEAKLSNGNVIDLFTGKTASFERPDDYLKIYKTYHFRKFFRDYSESQSFFLDENVGNFLCRYWNEIQGQNEQVMSYNLYFMNERTPPPFEPKPTAIKTLKISRVCQN